MPLWPPPLDPPPPPCDAPPDDMLLVPMDRLVADDPLARLDPPLPKLDDPELVEPLEEICAPEAVRNPPLAAIRRAD